MAEVEGSNPSVPIVKPGLLQHLDCDRLKRIVDVPEISMKGQLKRIVELQKIDGEIYRLKMDLKEKPAVLEELKSEFETRQEALRALEGKLKAILVSRREKELQLKTREEEIAKANTQLSQIKTNKEYTAKLSEIEHIKADQSIIEEKILMSYEDSDAVAAEIEQEKVKVAQDENIYLAQKKETEVDIKVIEDRIKVLQSQRTQASEGIDLEILTRYDRILQH